MKSKMHRYEGTALTVVYDSQRCIHAAECVHGLPEVFDVERRPWVAPDAAAADQVAEVIGRCPSGALHYQPNQPNERTAGVPAEEPAAENAVTVNAEGPLALQGRIEIASPDGTVLLTDVRATLCRCGASRNKPFCDRSHVEAGFRDPGVWNGNGKEAMSGEGPALHVVCCPDGPLVFQGTFALRRADGRAAPLRRRAFCRCGGSAEKPFCDGSHARIGFRTGERPEGSTARLSQEGMDRSSR